MTETIDTKKLEEVDNKVTKEIKYTTTLAKRSSKGRNFPVLIK